MVKGSKKQYPPDRVCSICKINKDIVKNSTRCTKCLREQKTINQAKYRKTPKGRVAKKNNKYRRERLAVGTIKATEWIALCNHYDNRCLRCGEQKPLTVDHIIPLTKGGSNTIDNVQPLCGPCNNWKKTKTIDYR